MKNDSRYNIIYNNDVSTADEQKKFDITVGDVINSNAKEISKSFDEDLKLSDFIKL